MSFFLYFLYCNIYVNYLKTIFGAVNGIETNEWSIRQNEALQSPYHKRITVEAISSK